MNKLVLPVMEKVPSSISRVRNVMEQVGRKKGRRFRFKFLQVLTTVRRFVLQAAGIPVKTAAPTETCML